MNAEPGSVNAVESGSVNAVESRNVGENTEIVTESPKPGNGRYLLCTIYTALTENICFLL